MTDIPASVADFLAQKRIAVAGVSRGGKEAANFIFRKLRDSGYEVVPVNPKADRVEGVACYRDLSSVPQPPDGVVIATTPAAAHVLVEECRSLGIERIWMHRSFGNGSVSEEAAQRARDYGISVIEGGCPLMYCQPVDVPHRMMRWFLSVAKKLPRV